MGSAPKEVILRLGGGKRPLQAAGELRGLSQLFRDAVSATPLENMNSIYRKSFAVLMLLQGVLISSAAAHPGAPGHSHDDEWPFDMLPALGVGAMIVVACLALSRADKKS